MNSEDQQRELALKIMERQERENMLNDSARLQHSLNNIPAQQTPHGYHELFFTNLPSRGMYQPKDAKLYIRSAKGTEITKWSSFDENDFLSTAEGLNSILSSCIMYRPMQGQIGNYKDLRDEDRFHIILAIRDLTFPEPENKLKITTNCVTESCGKIDVEVNSKNLELSQISEKYLKYYDEQERCFKIKTKTFGEFKITPPSIGVTVAVSDYIKDIKAKGKDVNIGFLNMLPYLVTDFRDLKDLSRIKELESSIIGWNAQKTSFFLSVIQDFKIGITAKLKTTCEKCEQMVVAPLTFPNGIKSIFLFSNIDSELL